MAAQTPSPANRFRVRLTKSDRLAKAREIARVTGGSRSALEATVAFGPGPPGWVTNCSTRA